MQLKFFTFPVLNASNEEESLNKFLRSVKVPEIKRELVMAGDNAYWAICVLYLSINNNESNSSAARAKTDYKELLSDIEFKKFCYFRKIRKQIADSDAVPAFAVFTDHELSEIAKLEDINSSTLKKINGIGVKKIEKYGLKFCTLINEMTENEEGKSLV